MIEKGKNVFVCFIDFTKASDRVNYNKLMDMMKSIGTPFNERRMITHLYWNQTAKVRYSNELTDSITITKGVRQGCMLSPVLFNLYGEMLITEAFYEEEGVKMGGEFITTMQITQRLLQQRQDLKKMMKKIRDTYAKYGMSLNAK